MFIRQTVDILAVHTLQMWSSLNAICAALYSVHSSEFILSHHEVGI